MPSDHQATLRRTGVGENTYEEGECLLELGDLLLGERVGLQYAVSSVSLWWTVGWRGVDFQGGVRARDNRRGGYAPCLLWGVVWRRECRVEREITGRQVQATVGVYIDSG